MPTATRTTLTSALGLLLLTAHASSAADALSVIEARCLNCHGGSKTKGGLDLRTRDALVKGGDSGPVVVPGDHRASLMYKLVAHAEEPHMPQKGEKLSGAEVEQLAKWIDAGARYERELTSGSAPSTNPALPGGAAAGAAISAASPMVVTEEDRRFWSFRPLVRAEPPHVRDEAWVRNPVDCFVRAAQEAKGLAPAP